MVGILARVAGICAQDGANVLEVSQTVLQDVFAMIMLVDISKATVPFAQFADDLAVIENELSMKVHVMHEDIFDSMHRI
jgi:ACT domain-containing protein